MKNSHELFPEGLVGLIYDCDGVMINSREANTLFYNRVLDYFGLPPMTAEQERYSFMATGMQALWHILPKKLHPEIDRVITEEISYSRDIVPRLKLMPKFREFVLALQDLGLKQAMCTNRTTPGFAEVLSFFDFPKVFDPIITVSKVAPKPSSEGALAILQAWKAQPSQVLFVGDSAHDMEAARGAKVPFAAFNALDCQGDLCAASWPEMARLLQPWLQGELKL